MFKRLFLILFAIAFLMVSWLASAQTYFGTFNNQNSNQPSATYTPQGLFKPNTPSADEYKNAVQSRYQQYQQEISNQAKQLLAKPPTTTMPLPSNGSSSLPTLQSLQQGKPTPPPQITQPIGSPTPITTAPSAQTPPPNTSISNESGSDQSGVYSGFQGGGSSNPPANNNKGGWDINY